MPPKAKKPSKVAADAANGKTDKSVAPPSKSVEVAINDTQDKPEVKTTTTGSSKPDQALYHAEQEKIKGEIDAIQVKLSAVREKISSTSKNGPGNERRTVLRAELDTIRGQQSSSKTSRAKLMEQLKTIQDSIQKKVKDLQTAKSKAPYKTVADVDAQVKQLEKQVESGSLKLGDEKRALQEISSLKRSRRTVESFQADQQAIEAERARADEIRKQLDDPQAKAASERYDAIRAELDELKKEGDEAFAGRNKLFDERNALSAELDALYTQKRESAQHFREASDKYWQKVNEERARRAERLKAQRAAEEEEKRKEVADRLLEEARAPAFQAKIEDCQTLIDYFNAKISGGSTPVPAPTSLSTSKPAVSGVPKLELRQVEQNTGEGLIARKKKGEDEESYFVGGKNKKGKKGGNAPTAPSSAANAALNIPFATLTALLDLSIPPPASTADLPRAVEDLKTKKAWYEANQERVTKENIAKAEAQVKRLASGAGKTEVLPAGSPPALNGNLENPPEPVPTPSDASAPSIGVPSEAVDEKLDTVKENLEGEETVVEAKA